jgi:hypothetical protein
MWDGPKEKISPWKVFKVVMDLHFEKSMTNDIAFVIEWVLNQLHEDHTVLKPIKVPTSEMNDPIKIENDSVSD